MRSPTSRAMVSVGPPAGYGTTMVTGRDGKPCAAVGPTASAQQRASKTARIRAVILVSLCRFLWLRRDPRRAVLTERTSVAHQDKAIDDLVVQRLLVPRPARHHEADE